MRIIFVTNNYTPYSGGVISSIDATVQELRAQGHTVLIVTLNFLGDLHKKEDDLIRITCPIRFMYKKNHMAIPWRPTHELLLIAKQFSPDVIHVHHPFLLGESGLEVARILDIPCIFTYHTLYEHYAHYVPLPIMCSQPIIRWAVQCFCKEVDGIIVPSNAVKHYVREQSIIAPIEVIPSALRTLFLNNSEQDINIMQTDKKFFELLLISRFTQEKNIPFVFDVLKLLPDNVRLTLVGYGEEYNAMQHRAFKVMGLSHERVHFIYKPDHTILLELYKRADLFIFPSQKDTQGLVLAEAMSQGLPVIALNGPGQRDIICNGENGYIVSDVEHAVSFIQTIINNVDLHKHLKYGAYLTALQYKPSIRVQQILNFYETLISN